MKRTEVYKDKAGEYRWRTLSGSDVVSDSGEGYESVKTALAAAKRENPEVTRVDVIEPTEEEA
jgi:uncharacterized protein YegP (UPF0339 family)